MLNEQIIIDQISRALKLHDNKLRAQAEEQIVQMRNSDPSKFFALASGILPNESYQPDIRQQTGTVISRLITLPVSYQQNNENNAPTSVWDYVNPQSKQIIKNNALSVLVSKFPEVMRAGAQVIARIAALEIPRGQWSNLIDLLAENCSNNDDIIKNASLTTLGFICEQIKTARATIDNRLGEEILGSLILGLKENNKFFIKTCLEALTNSLPFLYNLMRESKYRDTVFYELMAKFDNSSRGEQDYLYNVLYEFVKVSSHSLGAYKGKLLELSERHIGQRDDVCVYNLQMWSIIGTDYIEKVNRSRDRITTEVFNEENFLQSVADIMLPQIMNCLVITNKNEEEDNTNLREATVRAVSSFAEACDRSVVTIITDSVAKIINLENPQYQQATVLLFSCISDHPDEEYIKEVFSNGFDHLFRLLQSGSQLVIKSTLLGFERLSETFPEVFLVRKNIAEIIDILFGYVQVNYIEVQSLACQIISNITEGLKNVPDPVSNDPSILLTKTVQYFTNNMVQLHNSLESRPMNEKLTSIVMNIVMTTNKRETIEHLIEYMIQEYYKVFNLSIPDLNILIEEIISVLHTSVLAHKNTVANAKTLTTLCELVDKHFHRFGVEQEGLSMLGAIATTFNKAFISKANHYWKSVMHGFESPNDPVTFKASLACIGDFARMSESDFNQVSTPIMERLLKEIKQNEDRETKLHIIACMGDLTLSMQQYAESYLQEILAICQECFQAVYIMTSQQNESEEEYLEELKSNLIELYACVVFAVHNKKEPNRKTFDHFQFLATFVIRTCSTDVRPTIDYLVSCLYLIFDSAAFYWTDERLREGVNQIILSNEITELIENTKRFENRPNVKELLKFIKAKRPI